MCDADTVQYLSDLIQEKEYLDKLEGHTIIKSLLDQGRYNNKIKGIRFSYHLITSNDNIRDHSGSVRWETE